MRILWFTNGPLIEESQSFIDESRNTGGWMVALLSHLRETTDWEFAIVTATPQKKMIRYTVDGIDCFLFPQGRRGSKRSLKKSLRYCCDIVGNWKPDLIHIHGTERFYGLVSALKLVNIPVVISLQGLIGPCSKWHNYFGDYSIWDVLKMHRLLEPFIFRGLYWIYWKFKKRRRQEQTIIAGNQFFLGRTFWDRSNIRAINPEASYHFVGELLRKSFWNTRWELEKCIRYRIIFTNAYHPRKGTEVLLNALRLLLPDFPNIELCIAGSLSHRSGFGRYLRRQLLDFPNNVIDLGFLNAEKIAMELKKAHVFVSPSFIDNSSNAICEAQLIGMPLVASYTGGVPCLIEEGKSGLFFPIGDSPVLASRLREIFENDILAQKLGENAHLVARLRHDPEEVIGQLKRAYFDALQSKL